MTRVDFVAVPSTDWTRSRAFYVDTLGLRPDATGAGRVLGRRARASGSRSRRTIGHGVRAAAERPHRACTSTTSPAAARSSKAKGVEFSGEIFDTGVCHMAFFARPGRQRADAPPPLRADARPRMITVERTDFISVPVDRSRALDVRSTATRSGCRRSDPGAGLMARVPARREREPLPARHRAKIGQEFKGPHYGSDRATCARRRRGQARARGGGHRVHTATSSTRASATWRIFSRPRRQRAHAPPAVCAPRLGRGRCSSATASCRCRTRRRRPGASPT